MGYIDKPEMVRVDFFRPSGKWYTTEAVEWLYYGNEPNLPENYLIVEIFHASLRKHFEKTPGRLIGMVAVCLEPYYKHAHPVMIRWEG